MNNFINIRDISVKDLKKILFDANKRKAKRKKLNYLEPDKDIPLKGRFLIQMFEKSSTRTRLSFYLAIRQLGGGALNLRKDELHFGEGGESIHDTARILSNYGDIFMLRTDSDKKLQEFKRYIKIPIINGLSPSSHPTQILSDIFTIEEIKKQSIHNLNICWIGDSNNVLNSLIEASVKFSFSLKIASPKKYEPSQSLINWTKKNKKKKLQDFKNFQVNSKLMKCAKKKAIFLHCLPASRGQEVSAEVIDGKQSKVWQQALNRLHVQKSILLYCLEKLR